MTDKHTESQSVSLEDVRARWPGAKVVTTSSLSPTGRVTHAWAVEVGRAGRLRWYGTQEAALAAAMGNDD
jgi:hypothetical protein